MSFMDKAKEAAEKFKDSDNEQVNKVKEYGDIDELMAISYIYDQDKQIESYRRLERAIKS